MEEGTTWVVLRTPRLLLGSDRLVEHLDYPDVPQIEALNEGHHPLPEGAHPQCPVLALVRRSP